MSFYKKNGCQSVLHTVQGQSCVYCSISVVLPSSQPRMPVSNRKAQNLIDKKRLLDIFFFFFNG